MGGVHPIRIMKLTLLLLAAGSIGCANAHPKPVEPVSPSEETPAVASVSAAPAAAQAPSEAQPAAEPEPTAPEPPKFPSIEGTLDGKPFEIKGAATSGPVQKDGTVLVVLTSYPIECGGHDEAEGERSITLAVPWKSGAKADVAKLGPKGAFARNVGPAGKAANIKGFKPTGSIEVLGAPAEAGRTGRIRFALASGKDAIEGEVPVKVCF